MTTTIDNVNKRKLSIDQFRGFAIFGMIMVNYLNHFDAIIDLHGSLLPSNAPLWQALTGFIIIYSLCYLVAHYLWRNKMIVKL